MISLKQLLSEAKRPPYRFTALSKKNSAIKLIDQIKSCRSEIVKFAKKQEYMEACYVLNKKCKGYPVQLYFSIDGKEFETKSKDESPFSYGEQVVEKSAFYNEKPHIVFNLNKYFFDHVNAKDYNKLFGFFNSVLNHEIIHVNQHKEYHEEIINYFNDFKMTEFIEMHESGEVSEIIKKLKSNYKKANKTQRGIIANQYLLNPVELPAYAFSCVVEFTASILKDDSDIEISDLKDSIVNYIDTDKGHNKSKSFKIFNTFIKDEYPKKYKQWVKLVKEYLYKLDDSYFITYT